MKYRSVCKEFFSQLFNVEQSYWAFKQVKVLQSSLGRIDLKYFSNLRLQSESVDTSDYDFEVNIDQLDK